ncbi:ATP-binding cassette domain-containing protein [Streptomyces sp. NPDC056144]|uniref:ABC transporter ATP-binding protein n=1 Tax=unclassified Streptomyces TaxID=2593676 RepID=UPI0035D92579
MRAERVGRRYGPRGPWVLRGVDLALPAAALVRCVGGNGTGKSTLLRLLAGIDAPTEGRITGRPPRTAYVPERFPAALPFTAVDYLVHLGRIQGLGGAAARARAGEWLERFGAAAYARTPLADLSKGTGQKVAVAQALLAAPDLLVLDEAWTGLDTGARAELDRAVRERVADGGTVLFVDHDPRRLAGEADAVYAVEAGAVRVVPEAVREEAGAVREEAAGAVREEARASSGAPLRAPLVRITASGGEPLPEAVLLPGQPLIEPSPAPDTLVFTVHEAHSDALLETLLAAFWHIRQLRTEEAVRA